MVTIRVRSLAWLMTGALLATAFIVIVTQAWRVGAAPGDEDSTFVPIPPCRLADTRPPPDRIGPAGSFATAEIETFAAHGANGECIIPDDAVALSLNVTAVGATLPTFLTIWPDGDRPLASSLNPFPGQPPAPNAVTTPLASDGSFRVFNLQGSVDVVIDVNGFHTDSSLKQLAASLPVAAASRSDDVIEPADPSRNFIALSTTIEAPTDGMLQIVGSVFVRIGSPGAGGGQHDCELTLGSGVTDNNFSPLADTDRRAEVAAAELGTCSTNGSVAVSAGTHVVNLVLRGPDANALYDDATLDVLFVAGAAEVTRQDSATRGAAAEDG